MRWGCVGSNGFGTGTSWWEGRWMVLLPPSLNCNSASRTSIDDDDDDAIVCQHERTSSSSAAINNLGYWIVSIVFDESIMIIVILSIFWLVVCCHRPCAVSGQWHLRLALAPSNVSVRHLKLLLFCCVSWINSCKSIWQTAVMKQNFVLREEIGDQLKFKLNLPLIQWVGK